MSGVRVPHRPLLNVLYSGSYVEAEKHCVLTCALLCELDTTMSLQDSESRKVSEGSLINVYPNRAAEQVRLRAANVIRSINDYLITESGYADGSSQMRLPTVC